MQILTDKTEGKLETESKKSIMTLRNKIKRLIIQNLSALAQVSNITIFLGLESFAENIYNDNLSLKSTKIEQRIMEYMIGRSEKYNPNSEKNKEKKTSTLLNAK